jgi:hypothetical protein
MTDAAEHCLSGLEPDNLLAFLALLGLLRALDTARPEWQARAFWDDRIMPLRPVLVLKTPVPEDAIAAAAAEGTGGLARSYRFDRKDLNYPRDEARRILAADADATTVALMDALMSDGALRNDESIWPTPFCFLFGQGHQHFLSRLRDVPMGQVPLRLAKSRKSLDLNAPHFIAETLFAPWTRTDLTDGFRWDPIEDRRYALRASDPSTDQAGTQHGANRLAALGLGVIPGTVVRRREGMRFLNAGTRYSSDNGIAFTWPIWMAPARLSGILALLLHPGLAEEKLKLEHLASLGIQHAFRARRISVGKFYNVTRADCIY